MISIILGITIPILYLAIGSAVGIKVYDSRPDKNCASVRPHRGCNMNYPSMVKDGCDCGAEDGRHSSYCDCCVTAFLSAVFWPIAGVFLAVWVLMKGTKQPRGTRIGRAQRRVRKMQARIDELQRELGMEP